MSKESGPVHERPTTTRPDAGRVAVLSIPDPFSVRNGATIRTRAMITSFTDLGMECEVLHQIESAGERYFSGVSPSSGRRALRAATAGLGGLKRDFLPMPTMLGARDPALARRAAEVNADLVVIAALSQMQFAEFTQAPVWFDFMDIWSEVARREARLRRKGVPRLTARMQAAHLVRLESRYARAATVVTTAGWSDCQELRRRGIDAIWLPLPVSDDDFGLLPRDQSERRPVAGLIADFAYAPNRDAFEHLRRWTPALIRRGWRVVVAGRQSSLLPAVPGVQVLGEVAEVDDFYRLVDATLAPINLGGGIKVKVIESLIKGRPVIGTRFAFEGFPPEVRALMSEVALVEPDFPSPDSLRPVDPHRPELAVFRASRVNEQIREIVVSCRRRHGLAGKRSAVIGNR